MTKRRGPPARAAALGYERGVDEAPRLLAKGQGVIADRILEIARDHGIPIHQDRALVDVLSRLDVEEQIPPELYVVVAQVLAFIYRAEAAAASRPSSAEPERDGRAR